jgi:hypothetical protein
MRLIVGCAGDAVVLKYGMRANATLWPGGAYVDIEHVVDCWLYITIDEHVTYMDVSHFAGGSSFCTNTMVFSAEHYGYFPPHKVEPADTMSNSRPACLFRNVCCLPIGAIGYCGACWCGFIDSRPGTDGKNISENLCTSVTWWCSHTICIECLQPRPAAAGPKQ